MNGRSISDILAMSGYGVYVWSAFIVTFVAVIGLFFYAQIKLKKAIKNHQNLNDLLKK